MGKHPTTLDLVTADLNRAEGRIRELEVERDRYREASERAERALDEAFRHLTLITPGHRTGWAERAREAAWVISEASKMRWRGGDEDG